MRKFQIAKRKVPNGQNKENTKKVIKNTQKCRKIIRKRKVEISKRKIQ